MSYTQTFGRGPSITKPVEMDRPDSAGWWFWEPHRPTSILDGCLSLGGLVTVTENPSSGRMCLDLGMGGSIHCGLKPWSGRWRKVK